MWLKNATIDLAITLIIVLWVAGIFPAWGAWIVFIYTPFIAALKILALASGLGSIKQKQTGNEPPNWFYHLLFAINVAALLYGYFASRHLSTGIMACLWILIWVISAFTARRS